MARPIVYGPAGSTYVWSTRLALAEKGVAHELVDIPVGAHQCLAGERISLADLMAIPLLYYFSRLPEGEAPLGEHPGLRAWIARMEGRQSFQVTKPPGV